MRRCQWAGCRRKATDLAFDRYGYHHTEEAKSRRAFVLEVCAQHANATVRGDGPEYTVTCPHCECQFGVG